MDPGQSSMDVIPEDTYALYTSGRQADIPLLVGYNDDEAAYMVKPIEAAKYVAKTRAHYGVMDYVSREHLRAWQSA